MKKIVYVGINVLLPLTVSFVILIIPAKCIRPQPCKFSMLYSESFLKFILCVVVHVCVDMRTNVGVMLQNFSSVRRKRYVL